MNRIQLWQGDITTLTVDAIVNAANETLLGGGGVDGAIHRAAGPELLAECQKLVGCRTGQAKITGGYRLKARHVIHTPGPVWHGGTRGEADLLTSCYHSCLQLASEYQLHTLAFPSISTGIYGYPLDQACRIALRETAAFLKLQPLPETVTFVCFSRHDFEIYQAAWHELKPA